MDPWLSVAVAYAIGCLSFATWIARLRGVDIRAHGSGNPGATNVGRVLGRRWGLLVMLLDVAKGWLPVALLAGPAGALDPSGRTPIAAAVVAGHVFPVVAGFRGGKGVATTAGAYLALDPLLGLLSVAVHYALRRVSGFVAVASVALAWTFPLAQLACRALGWTIGRFVDGAPVLALLALLVTLRHADNFRRMRAGTEGRYDARSASTATGPAEPSDRSPSARAAAVTREARGAPAADSKEGADGEAGSPR